jgi:RNA polymerase sigma-70 factor (ECF subfamily)
VTLASQLREPCGLSYEQLGKLTDELVMTHLVGGHGDAAAVLLDRYIRLVTSIAYKIVRDPAEAEDVAQEVFVDLCRTAAQFDAAKGTAKMWIIRTAYRRSLSRRRNARVRDAHVRAGLEDVIELAKPGDTCVAGKLSSYESQRLVRQILGQLDRPERLILELVFFNGLSLREVATKLGATLESVRHRYYRSIHKLRKLLNEERAEEKMTHRETLDAEA